MRGEAPPALAPDPERLRAYLGGRLLPLWAERGVDRAAGLFEEALELESLAPVPLPRRLTVQARQTYVFAEALRLGLPGPWRACVALGLAAIAERYWDPRRRAFRFALEPGGGVADPRCDTYAVAFVLFAAAHALETTGDGAARELLERAARVLERLRAPRGGGYLEGLDAEGRPLAGRRRQNPHMHLVEAFLAAHAATGELRWLERAAELVALCAERFLDPARGALREHFLEDWRPAPDPEGSSVEPGHHFEWTWLLERYASRAERAGGALRLPPAAEPGAARALAERLFGFAAAFGVDPRYGGVFDEIDVAGRVRRDTKRVWPQTEFVKALLVRAERGRAEDAARLGAELERLARVHVHPSHGGWRERVARDGRPVDPLMRASTPYHVVLALAEATRAFERARREERAAARS